MGPYLGGEKGWLGEGKIFGNGPVRMEGACWDMPDLHGRLCLYLSSSYFFLSSL